MNKLLSLGVVTALALAGGQANAAPTCQNTTLVAIEGHPGFECTLDGLTFSSFAVSPSGFLNSGDVAGPVPVLFGRDEVSFGTGRPGEGAWIGSPVFSYTVTADPRLISSIDDATLVIHGSVTDFPGGNSARIQSTTSYTSGGTGLLTLTAFRTLGTNQTRMSGTFSQPVQSVTVGNSSHVSSVFGGFSTTMTGIDNLFSVTPVSVPEPMSLSLFGLGLAGLALARRRRS